MSKKSINKLDFTVKNIRNLLNKYEIKEDTLNLEFDNNDLINLLS